MRLILSFFLSFPLGLLSALDFPPTPPVEPRDASKTFHLLDGFEMQLIAGEPLVTDPVTGSVRLESGGARFGQTFDDWGNRLLCNIRNPCQHVVLPYRYLARNPYLVVPSPFNDCAEAGDQLPVHRTSPPEPWREFRARRWVREGSHLPQDTTRHPKEGCARSSAALSETTASRWSGGLNHRPPSRSPSRAPSSGGRFGT
ncbi:MAG: hypothetical protein KGS60_06265 [Verrucomicrobia bacterium]|nr:hypothetical protein [Verrucomicrobiota bacterium]